MNQAQVTGVYVLYLLVFGIGLILFAIWVFCLLGGSGIGTCIIDTANPLESVFNIVTQGSSPKFDCGQWAALTPSVGHWIHRGGR